MLTKKTTKIALILITNLVATLIITLALIINQMIKEIITITLMIIHNLKIALDYIITINLIV